MFTLIFWSARFLTPNCSGKAEDGGSGGITPEMTEENVDIHYCIKLCSLL